MEEYLILPFRSIEYIYFNSIYTHDIIDKIISFENLISDKLNFCLYRLNSLLLFINIDTKDNKLNQLKAFLSSIIKGWNFFFYVDF